MSASSGAASTAGRGSCGASEADIGHASFAPKLRLWQLISPGLPVGAYAYSSGLEQVVASGTVRNADDALTWVDGTLRHGLARTDLPVLVRVHAALERRDDAAADAWSAWLVATRETAELRFADLCMGEALMRLAHSLGAAVRPGERPFAAAFAAAAVRFAIPAAEAAAGYAFSWCESHVAAAVKLVPLGHTAGQRVMLELGRSIETAVGIALDVDDDEIGFSMPGASIASAKHETLHTRLFRS